jgi:hypothetical protein
VRLPIKLGALATSVLVAGQTLAAMEVLPPDNAPKTHWPWWLRIIAVIAALAFVQVVARSLRRSAGQRGPGPTDNS